ncbi:MAG: asparagine synthase (glutamine-hydrolyzing) [Phycisphaerae bacterium]
MCGFAGIIQWNSPADKPAISDATLDTVDQLLAHRGPDGTGRWRDPHNPACALLHRRLSIVDLAGGGQPMGNEDQSVQVVFNGEIYNHRDLRSQLKQLGHSFASDHSDTEVLVHGWEQWNSAMLEKLTGMFAFAIWDTRSRTLFLARDRMGQKPLFYQSADNVLFFASTLPALRALGARAVVSTRSVAGYLAHGYLPPPFTIYENIFQLAPGECLTARQDQLHRQYYWQPAVSASNAPASDGADISTVISAAVASQMHADVPMACFLSGGIDSTIIAGLMQRHAAKMGLDRINTISIGFAEAPFDETYFAQIAARHIGSQHHTFQVSTGADVMQTLQWLMRYTLGQPFADSSILPTYYLANCARMVAPCAISGDGGDELFGGYDRYRALQLITAAPRLSRVLANAAMLVNPQPRNRRFAAATRQSSWPLRYAALTRLFSPTDIHTLLPELPKDDFLLAWPAVREKLSDTARGAMQLDQRHYLPGDVLWKVDSASMANALEVRSPLLDHRVVAYAATLPTTALLNFRAGKLELKKRFSDLLPDAISRRSKQGFGLPIGQWFHQQLHDPLRDLLLSRESFFQSPCSRQFLEQMIAEHQTLRRDHTHRLFACLMLELWHRESRVNLGSSVT